MAFGRLNHIALIGRIGQLVQAVGPVANQVSRRDGLSIEVQHPRKQVVIAARVVEVVGRGQRTQVRLPRPELHATWLARLRVPDTIAGSKQIHQPENDFAFWLIGPVFAAHNLDLEFVDPVTLAQRRKSDRLRINGWVKWWIDRRIDGRVNRRRSIVPAELTHECRNRLHSFDGLRKLAFRRQRVIPPVLTGKGP